MFVMVSLRVLTTQPLLSEISEEQSDMAQACTQPDKCRTHKPILHVPQSAIVPFTTPEKPNGCQSAFCLQVKFCHGVKKICF
jgi:hypothetical protein